MKKLFLSLLVTLLPLVASAHDFEVDGIYYNITDNEKLTVRVTYRGTSATSRKGEYSGNVVIPETVAYDSKTYSVTSIEDGAFYDCVISMLTVGANVLSIGDNQSTPTKTIWLTKTTPNGYKHLSGKINYVPNEQYTSLSNKQVSKYLNAIFEVDGMTFIPINPSERTCDLIDYNSSLSASTVTVEKTVSFKNVAMTVKNIMPYTFYNNKTIKSITIKNEGNIGDYAFYGCKNLNSVTMDDNVTGIGYNSFENCTSLASIVIPNSVTDIGDYAFSGCTNISSATIGNSVTYVGDYVFSGCTNMSVVTIGSNVTTIGNYAFHGCTNLKIVINNSKLNITSGSESHGYVAYYAKKTLSGEDIININDFYFEKNKTSYGQPYQLIGYAGGETSLTFPDYCNGKTYNIYHQFFRYNKALTSIVIGKGARSLSGDIFRGCTNLSKIAVDAGNPEYDSRDNCNAIIRTSNNKLVLGCKNTIIPNNVTSIGSYAFTECPGLTSVTLGNNLDSIEFWAFKGCTNLTSITIPNGVTYIGGDAFYGCI